MSVLQALKTIGVIPKWVQVGNEIRPGMLWDEDVALSGASYNVTEKDLKDAPASATDKVVYPMNWANLGARHYRIRCCEVGFSRCYCDCSLGQWMGQRLIHLVLR